MYSCKKQKLGADVLPTLKTLIICKTKSRYSNFHSPYPPQKVLAKQNFLAKREKKLRSSLSIPVISLSKLNEVYPFWPRLILPNYLKWAYVFAAKYLGDERPLLATHVRSTQRRTQLANYHFLPGSKSLGNKYLRINSIHREKLSSPLLSRWALQPWNKVPKVNYASSTLMKSDLWPNYMSHFYFSV